jgi:hypothetical protein
MTENSPYPKPIRISTAGSVPIRISRKDKKVCPGQYICRDTSRYELQRKATRFHNASLVGEQVIMNQTLTKIWWGKSTERVLWKGKKMIESQKKPSGTLEDGRALWGIGDDDKK